MSEARTLRKNPKIDTLTEVPRDFDKKKIEEMDDDSEKQEDFYRQIRYRFADQGLANQPTLFAYTYNNKQTNEEKNKQPTPTEVEHLCSLLSHPYNDIWIPPVVPKLSGQAYLPYLQSFFEQARQYSNITFGGLIPHISRLELRLLSDFYVKEGVNFFVMDFAGKNPLDLVGNINEVLKMVRTIETQYHQPCYLHAMNVPFTKSHWKNDVISAKDILVFEMGFNSYGSSHIRRQLPKEFLAKMNLNDPHYRLFCRKDYGYYRDDVSGLETKLGEEEPTVISTTNFKSKLSWSETRAFEKLFNVERQCLEANEIRRKILASESLTSYLRQKSQVNPKYIKQVVRVARKS